MDSAESAKLIANVAAGAQCCVDDSLAVAEGQGRTTQLHALASRTALVGVDLERSSDFNTLEQYAGATGDDDGGFFCGKLLFDGGFALCEVIGVNYANAVDADGAAQCLKVNLCRRLTTKVESGGGVLLVSCHAGNGVVEYDNGRVGTVVCDIDKTGNARMHKRGVADDSYGFGLGVFAACFVKAVKSGNGCAHAKNGVKGVERLLSAESIAADVAENGYFILGEGVEQTSVGTTGAHYGRTHRQLSGFCGKFRCRNSENVADGLLRKLTDAGEQVMSLNVKTQCAAMAFDDAVKLFNDDNALNRACKVAEQLVRQRILHTQLEHAGLLGLGK